MANFKLTSEICNLPFLAQRGRGAVAFYRRLRGTITLLINLSLCTLVGCSSFDGYLEQERIGDLGHFEFREPSPAMKGIVVGAPHGSTDPDSIDYAKWISDQTGAGLVTAFGFKSKRLAVAQPIERSISHGTPSDDPVRRGSIYPEFNKRLRSTAHGALSFYSEIHFFPEGSHVRGIEIATSGFTFEALEGLKRVYLRIRDRALLDNPSIPRISMAIDPLDKISWRASGVKHHGVLMRAERGVSLRLPRTLTAAENKEAYRDIFAQWISEAFRIGREKPSWLPRIEVKLMEHGRLERLPSKKQQTGIVIGAPHGTFDEYTAEMVKKISHRTGFPAVIAKGFTPTEGRGWRINVNRPTERLYPSGEIEIRTRRASEVYRHFQQFVWAAARGNLVLYVDVHQNGRQNNIEVATTGISREDARIIKNKYREIRDRALESNSDIEVVDLVIEPIDTIEIGAWAAKASGILGVAKRSLHFELPAHRALASSSAREAYTQILGELITKTAAMLVKDHSQASQLTMGGR